MTDDPAQARRRAERRAFIRNQHPDAGGDPDAFIRGLAELDGARPARDGLPSVHRSRRPDRLVRQAVRDLRRRLRGEPPRTLH